VETANEVVAMGFDPREAAILSRCSKYAAQYIIQLREHHCYLEVLTRLEGTPGALFELDAEHAFYECLRAFRTRIEAKRDEGGEAALTSSPKGTVIPLA
jgi:hypothetical protein